MSNIQIERQINELSWLHLHEHSLDLRVHLTSWSLYDPYNLHMT